MEAAAMRVYPIRTARLTLRWPEMSDASALVRLLSEPSVSRNIPRIRYPYRKADAVAWLRRVRKPRFDESFGRGYDFMVEVEGEVVGSCHLSWASPTGGRGSPRKCPRGSSISRLRG
jgi:RimJ/RimL family protein N-acetyltransferase